MGMPINSYAVLSALTMETQSFERRIAEEIFEPYSLIAFILHDPKIHSSFDRGLADLFERLDLVTGDNLLFFALVDPPTSWKQRAQRREYYKNISDWEQREILNPNNAPQSADSSSTMFALMNSLNISLSELPCLVVTNNLNSREFIHFPVNEKNIVERMTDLGLTAERIEPRAARESGLHELLARYGVNQAITEASRLSSSLAETLSNPLSFIVAASPNSNMRSTASNQAQAAIRELYDVLNQSKNLQGDDRDLEVEVLATKILSYFALLNQKPHPSQGFVIPVDKELLEQESMQILQTASKVFDLLVADQEREIDSVLEMSDDFSPGVIALSKVFEREANLSMVHWIRKQMGISLPEYYDKFQPDVVARDGRTDFNKASKNGQWLPPGIGQSEVSMKRFAENGLPERWDARSYSLLMEQWAVIRERRNDAAHDRVTKMQALLEVQGALTNLAQNKCFEKFYEMKLAYSGRTHAS